jgi:hypothetical protein
MYNLIILKETLESDSNKSNTIPKGSKEEEINLSFGLQENIRTQRAPLNHRNKNPNPLTKALKTHIVS